MTRFAKDEPTWSKDRQKPTDLSGIPSRRLVRPQVGKPHRTPRRISRRRPQFRRPLHLRVIFWLALVVGATAASGATRAYRLWNSTLADLPETSAALTYQRGGTITVKSADGAILQKMGPASREIVDFGDLPKDLVQAFIASEDRRFYEHRGVDYRGIFRATLANLRQRQVVEGASTITQQLARIVFLDQERTFHRKAKEAMLALKLEQELTKQQILERYLNLVYLGAGAYGVGDAAWVYFGKSVEDLTLAESALIAGMAPAPSLYSPLVDEQAALLQRNRVIRGMLAIGAITSAEAEAALASEMATTPHEPKYLYSEFPYFTIYVQKQLSEILTPEQLEAGGLTVETSLNVSWQRKAEQTVQEAIDRYSRGQGFEQAALVAIDPRNGEIKAMVGGNDFNESQFNRVTQAQRQPGSTFKTFVYTTSIAAGFSPYKIYTDAKYVVDGYEPKNYGDRFRGDVEMRRALQSSINVVAVKTLVDVGFEPVIEMARRMGIQSELLPTYSLALGASEVNLLELTSAYGSLATNGMHAPVHGIRRVINSRGEVLYEVSTQKERAVDPETAAIMTWMLEGVVQSGTGRNAALDRPVAGKTGTSERNRDLWFVGYIPQLVAGVWMGNDDSTPTWGASSTAAIVWRMFMSQLMADIPEEDFPELPRLDGREGTIEAKPVKPSKVVASRSTPRQVEETADNPASDNSEAEAPVVEEPNPSPLDAFPEFSREPAPAPVVETVPVFTEPAALPAAPVPAPITNPPPPMPEAPLAPRPRPLFLDPEPSAVPVNTNPVAPVNMAPAPAPPPPLEEENFEEEN